ncbi:hypothetical protein F6B41_11760 [Microbacterium lushaniae]|nr:hypothetical protein F6B41_20290 [Microbacterium lushaniae]KAA9154912.1 hypothetical protein F6B41_11760 [Microbacterium lushaniae]
MRTPRRRLRRPWRHPRCPRPPRRWRLSRCRSRRRRRPWRSRTPSWRHPSPRPRGRRSGLPARGTRSPAGR